MATTGQEHAGTDGTTAPCRTAVDHRSGARRYRRHHRPAPCRTAVDFPSGPACPSARIASRRILEDERHRDLGFS